MAAGLMFSAHAFAFNPLAVLTETYSDWKARLFGSGHPTPAVIDAPPTGVVNLKPGHPQRISIGGNAPERTFAKGSSRYRLIELPKELEHASVRVQVLAQRNRHGRGHAVFKPVLYVFDGDEPRAAVEIKPLHLDIRPFRRTRLLGCVKLDKVQKFAVATAADVVGKSYESEVREAVKAPTPGGFYYSTDAVKVRLPYAGTGVLILEVGAEKAGSKDC